MKLNKNVYFTYEEAPNLNDGTGKINYNASIIVFISIILKTESAFVASLVIISGNKPFDVLLQGVYMTNIPFEAVCLPFCFFRIWALGVLWG